MTDKYDVEGVPMAILITPDGRLLATTLKIKEDIVKKSPVSTLR